MARNRLHADLRTTAQQAEAGDESARAKLRSDREQVFLDDAHWRTHVLNLGPEPYRRMDELMERLGAAATDADGIPNDNIIRPPALELAAYAVQNFPRCRIEAIASPPEDLTPEERAAFEEAKRETVRRMNERVKFILEDSNAPDLNEATALHAAQYGVGYQGVYVDRTLNDKRREVARLRKKMEQGGALTEQEWRNLKRLSAQTKVGLFVPEGVVWQRGLRSAFDRGEYHGLGIQRVSYHQIVTTESARARYGDDKIQPGVGQWGLGEHGKYHYGRENRTGLLTTWEIHEETKEVESLTVGPYQTVRRVVPMTSRVMVKTTLAANRLVDVEVYDSLEGLVELPLIPYYLLSSQRHPYGICVGVLHEQEQVFYNRVRNLIYKIALKSFTGQGGVIDARHLPSNVTAEEIQDAMQNGDWIGVDLGEGVPRDFSIRDLFHSGAPVVDGVAPALLQVYELLTAERSRRGDMVDLNALSSARSGIAKQMQFMAADRSKTITIGHLSEAEEAKMERVVETEAARLEGLENEPVPVHDGTVLMNERATVEVPRRDPAGNVVQVQPDIMQGFRAAGVQLPNVREDGTVTRPFDVILGDTTLTFKAQSETRGGLPQRLEERLQLAAFLAENELFLTAEAAREMALEGHPELKGPDDAVRQQRAEMAMMQQEQQMMEQDPGLAGLLPEEQATASPEQIAQENAQMERALGAILSQNGQPA